jgi:DNA-binding response OmpR family regulator
MKKPVILLVDDQKDILDSFQAGLGDRGYDVITAQTGAEALEILNSYAVDIIMADLRMQPMNGFDLFQNVKKNAKLAGIPFFFLTGVHDYLAQKYGSTLGVDAYITKPVDIDDLDAIVKDKLSGK